MLFTFFLVLLRAVVLVLCAFAFDTFYVSRAVFFLCSTNALTKDGRRWREGWRGPGAGTGAGAVEARGGEAGARGGLRAAPGLGSCREGARPREV